MPGYSAWTVKEGIAHVQPPESVLKQMIAFRMHLDPADDTNGALMVSPGSHKRGRISAEEAAIVASQFGSYTCVVNAGDAILMRPLLLHASCKSQSLKPRRIIHLEFASGALPPPLEWN